MKVGLMLQTWTTEQGSNWPSVLEVAKAAAAAGFDSLWVDDHILLEAAATDIRRHGGADIESPRDAEMEGHLECFATLGALAAVVPRVELGSLVVGCAYRNPGLLAKAADTLDMISEGRLILGLGTGDSEEEHERFGFAFDHPVGRFEETLAIVTQLLRTGTCEFEGSYYRAPSARLVPRGPRPKGPPIMIGTLRPKNRMRRLIVQYADSWNSWLAHAISWPEGLDGVREPVDEACAAAGRDPSTLPHSVAVRVTLAGATYEPAPGERPLAGSRGQIADALVGFAARGVDHVQAVLSPSAPGAVEELARSLELARAGKAQVVA